MTWLALSIRILMIACGLIELATSAPSYPRDYLPSLLHKHQRRGEYLARLFLPAQFPLHVTKVPRTTLACF